MGVLARSYCKSTALSSDIPEEHEDTVQDGDAAVGDEDGLPRCYRTVVTDQTEAICQQTTNDLLTAVHHVPIGYFL